MKMDIRTACLIVIGLCVGMLIALYIVIISHGKHPQQQTLPPGTQIEYRETIEIEGGSERHEIHEKHWSIGK